MLRLAAGELAAEVEAESHRLTLELMVAQPLFAAALGKLLKSPPLCAEVSIRAPGSQGRAVRDLDLVVTEPGLKPGWAAGSDEAEPPVLLLMDRADARIALDALEDGVVGILTKDATAEQLVEAVRSLLAGHRVLSKDVVQALLAGWGRTGERAAAIPGALTPAEVGILELIAAAHAIPVIASMRGITEKTVRNHLARIYRKINVQSRAEAMLAAARLGLLDGALQPAGAGSPRG